MFLPSFDFWLDIGKFLPGCAWFSFAVPTAENGSFSSSEFSRPCLI